MEALAAPSSVCHSSRALVIRTRRLLAFSLATLCSIAVLFTIIQTDQSTVQIGHRVDVASAKSTIAMAKNYSNSHAMWNKWTSHIRACLLARIEKSQSIWSTLHQHVSICVGEAGWRMLDIKILQNRDDLKFAILPKVGKNNEDAAVNQCTVVTLGVGNDVEAELKLQKLLPICKFYGADPSTDAGLVYESKLKGKYFHTAVTSDNGVTTASVLEKNGTYRFHKGVSAIGLSDFLSRNVSRRRIDYLFMDNEGAEYKILDQFTHNGILERDDIVVCQLSVELHGPMAVYGINETAFRKLVEKLVRDSPMLPMWTSRPVTHIRSFYINSQHRYCVEKYFSFND